MHDSTSLALLTDLYQLTMAQGYWHAGQKHLPGGEKETGEKGNAQGEQRSVFHLFFRRNPFGGGYSIAAGLGPVLDCLESFRFASDDIDYLRTLKGNNDQPLFDEAFLQYLQELRLSCDIDAIPEGTVVFPHEPLVRVSGPIIECQILETMLLNSINFQTLVATQASRICQSAGDDPVLEFGLRRAQGIDGGVSASRAAYIGGCAATSNVLAGKRYGIPVKGTHAHSWVMSFDDELSAFEAYAEAMPHNCVFLVDTYDTIEGVKKAIEVGQQMRQRGHEMAGIRLDSGDLAWLSQKSRELLDQAGFEQASIVASNDLDEYLIDDLRKQGACINVWGVGTKLATAYSQPALGGVYKLAAIEDPQGTWIPKIKLSEQAIKTSNPGPQQVMRYTDDDGFAADMIYNPFEDFPTSPKIVDPADPTRMKVIPKDAEGQNLLQPVLKSGRRVYASPPINEIRARCQQQLSQLHASIRRFQHPHEYPVGLETRLHRTKMEMIQAARHTED